MYLFLQECINDKPSINSGLKYLKYCIKIEKTIINFLSSTQKEYTVESRYVKLSILKILVNSKYF